MSDSTKKKSIYSKGFHRPVPLAIDRELMSYEEIGRRLGISAGMVRYHEANALKKLARNTIMRRLFNQMDDSTSRQYANNVRSKFRWGGHFSESKTIHGWVEGTIPGNAAPDGESPGGHDEDFSKLQILGEANTDALRRSD